MVLLRGIHAPSGSRGGVRPFTRGFALGATLIILSLVKGRRLGRCLDLTD
jgi:hypothetical protein